MVVKLSLDKVMSKYNFRVVDVEKRSGIHRNVITKYKNNELKRVDLDVIAKLCSALNCDISDLLEFKIDDKQTVTA